jgi:pyridoxal biosynthesis lyase PdxS
MIYLANAFSLQMLKGDAKVRVIEYLDLPNIAMKSVIGHEDMARILGVEMNRESTVLEPGDVMYVVQLIGGRLPEGCHSLPEGFQFKIFQVTVEYTEPLKNYLK